MPGFHRKNGPTLSEQDLADLLAAHPLKLLWFAQHGYTPHYWQLLFHWLTNPETGLICRFRHMVAGRRGGKTLAAAWDVVFYALHPEAFHWDFHGKQATRPLVIWVVTQDYPVGLWSKLAIRQVLQQAGLEEGKDYRENRGHQWIEFNNGTFLLFKTADNPNKLRGAGVDILWFDEAAIIPTQDAYEVSSPALGQTLGVFLSTTTPSGKNWLYNTFWTPKALASPNHGHVEYWSIDSPYFETAEWQRFYEEYHPLMFKQEFMASFDAMAGKELSGDWLNYYEMAELDAYTSDGVHYDGLSMFIGVDPAISLADTADRFAIAAIGVTKDRRQAYLVDQWAGRIPFPEQVDKINQWFNKYSPQVIGIEKTAYQAALAQQVQRLEGLPPVAALWARGKKEERILAMSPFFRTGRIRIRKDQVDFINEWVDYDSTKANPQDDCLDAVEMTLRTAGIILPAQKRPNEAPILEGAATTASMWSEIAAKASASRRDQHKEDDMFGSEW
jgi:predicted phage terminase large subunit-like protein